MVVSLCLHAEGGEGGEATVLPQVRFRGRRRDNGPGGADPWRGRHGVLRRQEEAHPARHALLTAQAQGEWCGTRGFVGGCAIAALFGVMCEVGWLSCSKAGLQ